MKTFYFNFPDVVKSMTIKRRFTFSVLVVVIFIMSLLGIIRIKNTSENIKDDMERKVAITTELAALSFSDSLWNYNDEEMRIIGDALFKDPEICRITVKTDRGLEVYKKNNTDQSCENSDLIIAEKEIVKNGVMLGVVTIQFTTYHTKVALQKEITTTIISISGTVLILWLLIAFISNMLTNPIYELSEGAEEIARGNLTKRLHINFDDEIGGLARRFNTMAESMYNMLRELEIKNKSLEAEIKNGEEIRKALAASEEKFFKAFYHVADVIGIIRLNDRCYIEVNDAFTRISGYERQEIIGCTSSKIGLWGDEEKFEKIYEILEKDGVLYNFEITWRTKTGEMRIGLTSAEVNEIAGECCIIYVWHDITDIKKAEEALRQAHINLEIKVEERTQDLFATNEELTAMNEVFQNEIVERKRAEEKLEQKNQELKNAYSELENAQSQVIQQEKMASIGQLAAGVAHEINNPIGFIISNLDSLRGYTGRMAKFFAFQEETVGELAEACAGEIVNEKITSSFSVLKEKKRALKIDYIIHDTEDLLAETLDGAGRVKKIVQGLKGFARMENEIILANINEGIESTVHIIWNEIKYKATLVKELGDIPLTKCNPGQLNQVFMNILVNAAHAIDVQGEICVKTWAEQESIFVSIRDTGVGIFPEALNKIFDPFYTTKEVGKGTGLGLSISYDIIKKHEGEIRVESEVGKGTTFTIKIPIVEQ